MLNDFRRINQCSWSEIKAPLAKPDKQAISYFVRSLKAYIQTYTELYPNSRLTLVSYPHKGHLAGDYSYEIGSAISTIVAEFNWVNHLDLHSQALLHSNLPSIHLYEPGDLASHPTAEGYQLIGESIKHYLLKGSRIVN